MLTVKKISEWFMESPAVRAFMNVIMPILSGLLSGVFTAQITGPKGLEWGRCIDAWALYPLVVFALLLFFYTRALYLHQTHVLNFANPDFCIAYMRSKCLPQAAEKYKELIREGKGGELTQAMAELKKSLK